VNDFYTMLSSKHRLEEAARHQRQAELAEEARAVRSYHDPILARLLRKTRTLRITIKREPQPKPPVYNPCQEANQALG
jgi:hypothetical protein